MHVLTVEIENFMNHARTRVDFPERGVVLVTGPNGAGKSTLVEAVAWAVWGETLRGKSPLSPAPVPAGVELTFRELTTLQVARRRSPGGKVTLAWGVSGEPQDKYETRTKAQTALEKRVRPWDVWRRCSVFSSSDAAHFTLAPDAARKALLETLLGLGRFDAAHDAAKTSAQDAEQARTKAGTRHTGLTMQLESARGTVRELETAYGALVRPDPEEGARRRAAVERMTAQVDAASTEDDVMRTRSSSSSAAVSFGVREVQRTAAALEGLRHSPRCEACGRAWDDVHVPPAVVDAATAEHTAARKALEAARAEHDLCGSMFRETHEELTSALTRLSAAERALATYNAAVTAYAQQEQGLAGSRALVARLEASIAGATRDLDVATAEARTAAAVQRVLSPKGVRAHVLGGALQGISDVANGWLERLAGTGLRLALTPYTETTAGTMQERISLEVTGAGAGLGYLAASNGERRRIDVALLLALGEVAAAAHGTTPGTMFLDEVLDGLDREGVGAAVDAVHELAADRAVVVITHNEDVVAGLRPALRLQASGGAYRVQR